MNAPICLTTVRSLRAASACAQLREVLRAEPPAALAEDEFGFVAPEVAQSWQPYFDALGLSDVQVAALAGEQFRELLAACLPMALAVLQWLDRPEPGEPVDDFERYLQSVACGQPADELIPEHLARLRDAFSCVAGLVEAETQTSASRTSFLRLVKG